MWLLKSSSLYSTSTNSSSLTMSVMNYIQKSRHKWQVLGLSHYSPPPPTQYSIFTMMGGSGLYEQEAGMGGWGGGGAVMGKTPSFFLNVVDRLIKIKQPVPFSDVRGLRVKQTVFFWVCRYCRIFIYASYFFLWLGWNISIKKIVGNFKKSEKIPCSWYIVMI